MTSVKEISMKLDKIKKREENKKCFDCGEKGTTYVCIDFGTFICSRCAGILRELNFKVKGTGVSIFNQKEIDILEKNGNDVAYKIWMAKYKEGKDKKPNNKNDDELREFLKKKYKDKKSPFSTILVSIDDIITTLPFVIFKNGIDKLKKCKFDLTFIFIFLSKFVVFELIKSPCKNFP